MVQTVGPHFAESRLINPTINSLKSDLESVSKRHTISEGFNCGINFNLSKLVPNYLDAINLAAFKQVLKQNIF